VCIFTDTICSFETLIIMKISSILVVLFAIGVNYLHAQDAPTFSFETTTHDFGKVEETGGPVSFTFNFKNTGNAPLVIQNVQPSCGCTTPDWTREPIQPGKMGFIKAEYNPMNRPGAFNKSLTVTANTNPAISRLFIQGTVNPKPRTIADDYPAQMGGLRARYRSFNFGKITTEKPVTRSFDVYNDSDQPITFLDKTDAPDFIRTSVDPKTLQPKDKGVINITYDPAKKNDLGFVTDKIALYTDETNEPEKIFMAVATIEEYFPPMTAEELAKAPRLSFDKTSNDFGNIKQTDKVSTEFVMTNNGKSVLNIRQTKSNCGCTVANLPKMTLAPGESETIKVSFDPTGRRGVQQKSISIFSNDPTNPTQMITIKAKVDMDDGTR
jgi:hypothetical protein